MNWFIVFAVITILIGLNALYVAGEFATVSARRSRLLQMEKTDSRGFHLLLPYLGDVGKLDTYVAACQIGITVSSLILGFYGQASLTTMLIPILVEMGSFSPDAAGSVAALIVLALLTVFQVVLGELVPKNIGVQYPERLALLTVRPVGFSLLLFRPLIWLFNGSGRILLRLMGMHGAAEHIHLHAPEEILMLVEESGAGGLLQKEERVLVENTLRLQELTVRQVMIPRTRMLATSVETSTQELLAMLATSPYSRIPLYDDSVDQIIGIVHVKDLLCLELHGHQPNARAIVREVPFVFENVAAEKVLISMQKAHNSVAIVLDEYGGTAGIVALEDLIEEIFGELRDEFDVELPALQIQADDRVNVRGDVLLTDLNEWLGLALTDEEVDTIGGLVFSYAERVPDEKEEFAIDGHLFRVERMDGNGIVAVSLALSPEKSRRLREE
ncbi:MAG: HlyC/CorC family transporter [Chloroflexi bacterium]|nr:MAG: HlyC/CorC family transporter [Chloroflexota bacterium]